MAKVWKFGSPRMAPIQAEGWRKNFIINMKTLSQNQTEAYRNQYLKWQHNFCWSHPTNLVKANFQWSSRGHRLPYFELHDGKNKHRSIRLSLYYISCIIQIWVLPATASHHWGLPCYSMSGLETSPVLYTQSLWVTVVPTTWLIHWNWVGL